MASEKTRKMVTLGVLAAIATVVMMVGRIAIVPAAPFLKYDPKDVVLLIAGFMYGPLPAMLTSLAVALIEMVTVSEAGLIGCLMNVLASWAFILPAAVLYRKRHSLGGALVGLVLGIFCMTGVMLLWNYFLTPFYMGIPRAAVAAMLLPVFLPFNLLKGALNASLAMLVYKPLANALRRSRRLPAPGGGKEGSAGKENGGQAGVAALGSGKTGVAVWLVAAFVVVSCVVGILVWQGMA